MNGILVVVDCNYLAYVNKFALSSGLSYKGGRTEIIFGFFRHVLELARQFETTHFAFCWDSRNSKRKEIFPAYKAKRHSSDRSDEEKEMDRIAFQQFDEIRASALSIFGFENIFQKDGYESDDLIASIVQSRRKKNIVVSSDNDLYQLLHHCSLYNISKKEITTAEIFKKEYGIDPSEWAEIKCLAGCNSDEVPGIPGVGMKTAIRFHLGELKKGKTFDTIIASEQIIQRNRRLVLLPFEDTGSFPIKKPRQNWQVDSFERFCTYYGFSSFLTGKYFSEWKRVFEMK
jgi:5'-3' exonuclease